MSRESTQSILKRLDPSWGNLQTDSDDSKYHESCQNDGRTRGRGKGDFSIVLGGRTKSPSNFIVTAAIKPSHAPCRMLKGIGRKRTTKCHATCVRFRCVTSQNTMAKFPHRDLMIATIEVEVSLQSPDQTQGYCLLTNKACVTKTEKLNEHPRNLLTSFCSATEGRLRETVPFRVTKFPLLKSPL